MIGNNKKLNNDGVILVFTLILMAALLSTALGFAYFIIGDINKARAIDDSIIAYYAADAGLEGSLYALRKQEYTQSVEKLAADRGRGDMGQPGVSWDITSSTDYEISVLRQRLYNGQSAKFFILNRGDAPPKNETKSIKVTWSKGDNNGSPRLQVNLTQLKPQSDTDNEGVLVFFTDFSKVEMSGGTYCYNLADAKINDINNKRTDAPVDYVVEMTVLGVDNATDFVDRLEVTAYNSTGCSGPNNSEGITNLTLKSRGAYNKSEQTIVAQILPKDPVSGILGFVLFSDQDITK